MKIALALVHIVLCLVLIAVVLMQPRKQGRFGGIFGGGTQADFGANQWQRFSSLSKVTVVVCGLFMVTSLALILI